MSLSVTCPDCDKKLKVKDEAAGKKIRCPACATVFPIPLESVDSDDDFLSNLEEVSSKSKNQRRAVEDDFDDADSPVAVPRSRKPTKGSKKKSKKSKGTSHVLIYVVCGLAFLFVGLPVMLALLLPAFQMARDAAANTGALKSNWPTFQHPLGFAQIDMPGVPVLNTKSSNLAMEAYSLKQHKYQMSLICQRFPDVVKINMAKTPGLVDQMIHEMETTTSKTFPGSTLISSRHLNIGVIQGVELKLNIDGAIGLVQFYILPEALIGVEFTTTNENSHRRLREKFINSLRIQDGNLLNGSASEPNNSTAAGPVQAPGGPPNGQIAAPPAGRMIRPPRPIVR